LVIDDLPTLKKYYKILRRHDTIIVQEFIPGQTGNLYYYVGYRSSRGEILVSFVARKLRTFPDTIGSECYLQSVHNSHLCKLGERILNKLNYEGPAGIDFKFDYRTRTFRVIEINCRLGISDGLLVTCGVDIPFIYYRDAQARTVLPELGYRENVYWWWFEKDVEWFREYRSRDGFSRFGLCRDLFRNKYSYAVYARDDLRPFSYMIWSLVRRVGLKLVGRFSVEQHVRNT
jgi:predicted ATP-grasp superfamily ATP-dependent carboligase